VNRNWTRDELLICFNFYCRTPFGRLHRNNPEIIELARVIGRTPNAVAMKLVNFASFDPAHQQRNVKGLTNASRQDRAVWEEFTADSNRLAEESEEASVRLGTIPEPDEKFEIPIGPTETQITRPMRLVQDFFRRAVLASYNSACAFCGLKIAGLVNASHIIPWKISVELRANPRNGLCLCALHDRAFDRGLMAVDGKCRVQLSPQLKLSTKIALHKAAFLDLNGRMITLPEKFLPLKDSLNYHLNTIFKRD
jgi:predicted restriction endonuclease